LDVLGISADYHDAAAALVRDGQVLAAAQEERFTRVKGDPSLPVHAMRWCLTRGQVRRLDAVVFYEKPLVKLHRLLETHLAVAPRGLSAFVRALPRWLRHKLWIEARVLDALEALGRSLPHLQSPRRALLELPKRLRFTEHHVAHAASAFYPSPFPRAAVLTIDGVGEWATATVGRGDGATLTLNQELRFPHSLGLLYTAATTYCGFRANRGEYKLMGLAPYGRPRFVDRILSDLVDLRDDGSLHLDMRAFGFAGGLSMTTPRFHALFEGPPRAPEGPLEARFLDVARSFQAVAEEIVLRMARHAVARTGERRLCLAGGVALNSVANGRLAREGVVDDLWVQPAAGDAGGALGAALAVSHQDLGAPRWLEATPQPAPHAPPAAPPDAMRGALLGPSFDREALGAFLELRGVAAQDLGDVGGDRWARAIAARLEAGEVLGLVQGPMEFGPRALGSRSILADARSPEVQTALNLRVKKRESFRPFAPAVLAHRARDYFDVPPAAAHAARYMLQVCPVRPEHRREPPPLPDDADVLTRVRQVRSTVPAVTHVDGSARVQTVTEGSNPPFHAVLRAFEERTGVPLLVNTSFNQRGEPIVCTPADAYDAFVRTGLDALVLGPYLVTRDAPRPIEDPTER